MMAGIEAMIVETFHLEHGRFVTDELKEILPVKPGKRDRKGFRICFNYNEKQIKFWKDRSRKALTASLKYVNQVGPLTGYFNYLFFGQPENEICTINLKELSGFSKIKGNVLIEKRKYGTELTSQCIKLQTNNTGKHKEYTHIVYLGSDDFFEIVYGKKIYYNFAQLSDSILKVPYNATLEGIIDKSKKRKKMERLKQCSQTTANRKLREKELRDIESMNILSARNVKVFLREANVVYGS